MNIGFHGMYPLQASLCWIYILQKFFVAFFNFPDPYGSIRVYRYGFIQRHIKVSVLKAPPGI